MFTQHIWSISLLEMEWGLSCYINESCTKKLEDREGNPWIKKGSETEARRLTHPKTMGWCNSKGED